MRERGDQRVDRFVGNRFRAGDGQTFACEQALCERAEPVRQFLQGFVSAFVDPVQPLDERNAADPFVGSAGGGLVRGDAHHAVAVSLRGQRQLRADQHLLQDLLQQRFVVPAGLRQDLAEQFRGVDRLLPETRSRRVQEHAAGFRSVSGQNGC